MKTLPVNPIKPPSYFAALGSPSCSIWGKSEIEWIALAYVQALANDGDTWKPLTREQVFALLTPQQKKYSIMEGFLTSDFAPYKRWFQMVADQLTDSDGAFAVGGLNWRRGRSW